MIQTQKAVSSLSAMAIVLAGATSFARMSPREIYTKYADGVVLIVAAHKGSPAGSAGTGSIIRSDGLIVTNRHVVFDAEKKTPYPLIHVFLKPHKVTGEMNEDLSRLHQGQVVAHDHALDLALVKIKNPPAQLTVIKLGDPASLGPGSELMAIGHPEQGGLWTITTGIIGAEFENFKGVPGKHVFQMNTDLNPGNSGGPSFDVRGYQVGVNTSIARKGKKGAIVGVNFAVKSSVVKKWAADHKVRLAYGGESLEDDSRVALAPAQPAKQPEPPKPAAGRAPKSKGTSRVYKDPAGRGYIEVEDEQAPQGEEYAPARAPAKATKVDRPAAKRHKPHRFDTHYRIRPRPYTLRRLFTAVDRVRNRGQDAFDDLEREIRRRRR